MEIMGKAYIEIAKKMKNIKVRVPSSDKANKKKRDPTAYNCFVKSQVKKGANMKVGRHDLFVLIVNNLDTGHIVTDSLFSGHHVNSGVKVEGAVCRGEEGLSGREQSA
jgi:hypothetical protein